MELLTDAQENGINSAMRRSAGAVERDGLENRCGGNSTQGVITSYSIHYTKLYESRINLWSSICRCIA